MKKMRSKDGEGAMVVWERKRGRKGKKKIHGEREREKERVKRVAMKEMNSFHGPCLLDLSSMEMYLGFVFSLHRGIQLACDMRHSN